MLVKNELASCFLFYPNDQMYFIYDFFDPFD